MAAQPDAPTIANNNNMTDNVDKQKLLDEILTRINNGDRERDSLEKISRSAKNEYKNQKIEIENQFEMIMNMLKATQQQLLTQLEEKHKSQQHELNGKISKIFNFTKKFRQENNELNKDNITQISDVHDRINGDFNKLTSSKEKYIHKNISVVLDTSSIMTAIQKIAYIQEKTEQEMEKQQRFSFHEDNKNLQVKPQIIALNTNSMNTKICVSWKLQPVRDKIASTFVDKMNGHSRKATETGDSKDASDIVDVAADNDNDDEKKDAEDQPDTPTLERSRNSISMTDDVDTSNFTMSVHEICSIDIEWRYSNNKDELNDGQNKKKNGGNGYKWNILDVEHHKILAFNLDTSIFDHILNTTRYGIYYFRITLYNRNSKISSKEMMITTFKIQIRHIADEWNLERKQKQLRMGFFNRKIATRDIPGKFRHIFGTLIVSKGVNVWTLKVKKCDPNRQKCSAMLGVINMNNRNNDINLRNLNQCFAHIGIGYGIFTTNGDVYHTKSPKVFGKEIKAGDVVQIMADFRGQTISFIVNNINWGIAFDRSHFPQNKMPNLGLAVALRGCDEIQLIDFVNEASNLFPNQKRRRSSSSSTMPRRRTSSSAAAERYATLEKRDSVAPLPGTPVPNIENQKK